MIKLKQLIIATTVGLSMLSSGAFAATEVGPLEPLTHFTLARSLAPKFIKYQHPLSATRRYQTMN